MEKKQSELCLEILRRFNKAGILKDFILVGSWCVYFYKDYFSDIPYIDQSAIKTRDIDFLINHAVKIRQKVNLSELLKDLGFIVTFKGNKGYMQLDHPDLTLEFLVPEKGKGMDKPYQIDQLGINATALRFLNFLTDNTIQTRIDDFYITLPHPANFALHKLIIYQRRTKKDKAEKDKNMAVGILKALINKDEIDSIRKVIAEIPKKWQSKIIKGLKKSGEPELLETIQKGGHKL